MNSESAPNSADDSSGAANSERADWRKGHSENGPLKPIYLVEFQALPTPRANEMSLMDQRANNPCPRRSSPYVANLY
jgi:hypothetical protein